MPEIVTCKKAINKCPHFVIYDRYHYNKQKWDAYHDWQDAENVAGECPECGITVKMVENKSSGDSIQKHKIEECQNYPYGNKKKFGKK